MSESPSTTVKMAYLKLVVVFICLCSQIMQAAADVIAIAPDNSTMAFDSLPAAFGPSIKKSGMKGYVAIADPPQACTALVGPPSAAANQTWPYPFFALIRRGGCDFDIKVLNAQDAGYMGAIVYNDEDNVLTTMSGNAVANRVFISSVFVGIDSGTFLLAMNYTTGFEVILLPYDSPSWGFYFLPFISVTSTCLLFFAIYAVAKYVRDAKRRRKARLSRDHLKKLPIKKFKKGDDYDVCAICLDDYEEGQKLRILPCNHAFHCRCIDPWLTNNRRTCPICKRKVVPPGMVDSDDDSDSDSGGDAPNENTPLLGGMEREDTSDHGAVGGTRGLTTPPPSPAASTDNEDDDEENTGSLRDQPIVSLAGMNPETSSADSYPLAEATLCAGRPRDVNVTVHSENEMEASSSSSGAVKA